MSQVFLLIINLIIYCYFSFKTGLMFSSLLFFKFLWDCGLFTKIYFFKGNLNNCDIYYYEYTGEYQFLNKEFSKISTLMNKFKLNKLFSSFGIYYDDPSKVDPKKCRAVVGIMQHQTTENYKDFFDYLLENSFKKAYLPITPAICSTFPLKNMISLMIGIKKHYSTLKEKLKNEEFQREFDIDDKRMKLSVEVYRNSQMEFYIPTKNLDKFYLHSS